MLNCKKCSKEFIPQKGLKQYCSIQCRNSRTWSEQDKLKKSISARGSDKVQQVSYSRRGKPSKQKKPRVTSKCTHCGELIEHRADIQRRYHKDCWLKVSGGYKKGSSRGKCGWYKGYWCDSSYELAWVIYNLDHNITFERNKQKFKYKWNNVEYNYIPDFVQNETMIEIKGFTTPQVEEKLKSVPNIKILYRKDLVSEFEYVKKTYGKDFIKLYEQ